MFPRARWETVDLAPVGLVREAEHRVESVKAILPTLELLSRDHRSLPAGLPLLSPGEEAKALIFMCPWIQLPTQPLLSRTCSGGRRGAQHPEEGDGLYSARTADVQEQNWLADLSQQGLVPAL